MRPTHITTWKVSLLLFGSGLCALVYQMAWLREFRLIFGASTAASAAVLAIFMGGLGLGSLLLGARADRQARPLRFYANLELIIACTAAATPLLLWAARAAYIATGGSPVLGMWGATIVRLLLAALVLVVPTFLMGGTLPAAARSVEDDSDLGRRSLAMLYGANTLGAVTGSALATFVFVEIFGTRKTLWAACLVNVLIALIARRLSDASAQDVVEPEPTAPTKAAAKERARSSAHEVESAADTTAAPPPFVLTASAIVGFAFLLMELVWYRMLSPILGGSTYTFGLILAMALLGIGLGGAAYAVLRGNRPATLAGFALTCALEAMFIAIPFALGDRLALQAMLLRSLASMGFWGLVMGWSIIAMIVVLPAAFLSGIQFPLLIALLGRGKSAVGRHVGLAYTSNTIGAIVGSLAGGFGLLPLLTAVNAWRAVVVVLAALAVATLALAAIQARADEGEDDDAGPASGFQIPPHLLPRLVAPAVASALALLLLLATGPTAVWRHGGIGAGRSDKFGVTSNALQQFVNDTRRGVIAEWEGVESSVAVNDRSGYCFYVNGKADGHVRTDAGTQVMSGLVGAMVHPGVKTAMVIGLGTGCTAGWLGAVPEIQRVDVVELEPAILDVARMCAAGNENVMANPKVKVTIGDAREALLTTPSRYDLIFSEPSNPYRAGIASLYTQEFYEACAKRLNPGGLFLQWLQGYEVDGQTVRTVYATLAAVFPTVETWRTQSGDMLLMAGVDPIVYDVPRMRERLAHEPYRRAMAKVWRVTDLEGFFAHHIANAQFAKAVAKVEGGRVNTDDQNLVEFSFARSVGRQGLFGPTSVLTLAQSLGKERPDVAGGPVDWEAVEDRRISSYVVEGVDPTLPPVRPNEPETVRQRRLRGAAFTQLLRGNSQGAVDAWKRQPRPPQDPTELLFLAGAFIDTGNEEAAKLIDQLRASQPVEADALTAYMHWRQRRPAEAVAAMEATFAGYQHDPWPQTDIMRRLHTLAVDVSRADVSGNAGRRLYAVLRNPNVMHLLQEQRMKSAVSIAALVDERTGSRVAAEAVKPFEPNVPWEREFLEIRLNAYKRVNDPLTVLADQQLLDYLRAEPFPFDLDLVPEQPPATQPALTAPTTGPATMPTTQPMPVTLPAPPGEAGR
jgi:spermidine synthase